MNKHYCKAKTELLRVGSEMVAYRRLGDESRQPLLYLNHLAATLDNCDPAVMDNLAELFYVIVPAVTYYDMARAFLTLRDPKYYLFFPMTAKGRAGARAFLKRIRRNDNKDASISIKAFRTQLRAIVDWGKRRPDNLSEIRVPVWVVNGDHDRMVPTSNSYDLAARLGNARLTIYPDAGHGSIFQYSDEFTAEAIKFLQ